jgi:hypothetical protein
MVKQKKEQELHLVLLAVAIISLKRIKMVGYPFIAEAVI